MRRFNFSQRWQTQVVPLLSDPDVVALLTLGMKLLTPDYNEGDPSHLFGRETFEGQRPRKGCLSWYQPQGYCHYIAPFCWAIGKKLYPNLNWGFVSGKFHTVVVGYDQDWQDPKWLMDILLFKQMSPEESLELVKLEEWKFHSTLPEYLASFSSNLENALKVLAETIRTG